MIAKKRYAIEGMHCTSCAMNIDMDLEDVAGVKEAKTSYAKQYTEIAFDLDKVTDKQILATIKKTGYTAKPVEKT